MIICASVRVRGHHGNRYGVEWVTRLHRAMDANLPVFEDRRHVCLTDEPEALRGTGIQPVDVAEWFAPYRDYQGGLYNPPGGWFAKVKLFDPMLFPVGDTVLYLDLDTLVTGPLAPMLAHAAHLHICADTADNKAPKPGVIRAFNSSVMSWRAGGHHSRLYNAFTPHALKSYRSDQDWIAAKAVPHLVWTYPPEYTQRLSACVPNGGPDPATRVVLCIKPKNDKAAELYPWFKEAWQ